MREKGKIEGILMPLDIESSVSDYMLLVKELYRLPLMFISAGYRSNLKLSCSF